MSFDFNSLHLLKQALASKSAAERAGLWANIHAKRRRGEAAAKPGDKDYPDSKNWKKVTQESSKEAAVSGINPYAAGERREFSPEEEAELEEAKSKIMPTLFQNYSTPVKDMMYSPVSKGLALGLPGALVGGLAGSLIGGKGPSGLGALAGAGLGGLGGGLYGYWSQQSQNDNLEELMRRMGKNPRKRDLLADAAYQSDLDRGNFAKSIAAASKYR